MSHTYYEQDDCRTIIDGLMVKKMPEPPPPPVHKWKIILAMVLWAVVLYLIHKAVVG